MYPVSTIIRFRSIATVSKAFMNISAMTRGEEEAGRITIFIAIHSLIHPAITLSKPDNLDIELNDVSRSLQSKGYGKQNIAGTTKRRLILVQSLDGH